MTVRLTCVGHLFIKQEGLLRKVPTTTESLPEAFELLESLWLFKVSVSHPLPCPDNYYSPTF